MDGNRYPNQANPDSSSQERFTLRLSDFEYYMYVDDSPQYPMTFCLKTHLLGELLRSHFERAIQQSLERHPLLRATISRNWHGHYWRSANESPLPLKWGTEETERDQLPRLDLKQQPGLMIHVHKQRHRADIIWQFHHACCDGLGALKFVGDVLGHYGELTCRNEEEKPKLARISPELISRRGELVSGDSTNRKSFYSLDTLLRRYRRLVGRKTMPLAVPATLPLHSTNRSIMLTSVLSRKVLNSLKQVARSKTVSLNDLFIRELFLMLKNWNTKHQALETNQWLRVGMPVDMRTPDVDSIPCCNMVSYMFLPRTAEECENPERLLNSIQEQTSTTLNQRLGNLILSGLEKARKIPGLLPVILKSRRPFATAILANVGDIRKHLGTHFPLKRGKCVVGNLVLERLEGVAPVRPGTRVSISLGIYAGELILNMNYDPHQLTEEPGRELLNQFTRRLESLAATQSIAQKSLEPTVSLQVGDLP